MNIQPLNPIKLMLPTAILAISLVLTGCGKDQPSDAQVKEAMTQDITTAGATIDDISNIRCEPTRNEGVLMCIAKVKASGNGETVDRDFEVSFKKANDAWFQKGRTHYRIEN